MAQITSNTNLISVCIPVYKTEPFLEQCLESVLLEQFNNFEVIVVSDASNGKDSKGRGAKKIVKVVQKECNRRRKAEGLSKVNVRFIEHEENRGLVEVRRTLAYAAQGLYITQVDSDDQLEKGALAAMYATTRSADGVENFYDIVHGTSVAGTFADDGSFVPSEENRYGKIFYGSFLGHQVFNSHFIGKAYTSNTWGKLIKRELYLQAYENIPYTRCNLGEDVLLIFFISLFAKSYIGIKDKVYRYRINTGMTSRTMIDNLERWEMMCSVSSVFTVISQYISENQQELCDPSSPIYLSPQEIQELRDLTIRYLGNNILSLRNTVAPELKSQAYQMLCDYWGQDFVESTEKLLEQTT
ncbi:MAG: glycosyltransferase family 2 protein [Treponema sp.]|nr:glycosyltransferase family 2 protein [Treponema sp.]